MLDILNQIETSIRKDRRVNYRTIELDQISHCLLMNELNSLFKSNSFGGVSTLQLVLLSGNTYTIKCNEQVNQFSIKFN